MYHIICSFARHCRVVKTYLYQSVGGGGITNVVRTCSPTQLLACIFVAIKYI